MRDDEGEYSVISYLFITTREATVSVFPFLVGHLSTAPEKGVEQVCSNKDASKFLNSIVIL